LLFNAEEGLFKRVGQSEEEGGREAFGLSSQRPVRAAEKALELGLVEIEKRSIGRGHLLRPAVTVVSA